MENTFISYLLFFCLTIVLLMYLNQNMNTKCIRHKNTSNPHTIIHPSPNTHPNHLNNPNHLNTSSYSNINTNPFDTCKTIRTSGMPVHSVGPVINFHQHFTKYTTNPTYTTVKCGGNPTGIPELGWRNMYISNYSKNEIPEDDPFSGIVTRNFLDNMSNVDNIYRKCF